MAETGWMFALIIAQVWQLYSKLLLLVCLLYTSDAADE